MFLEDNKKTWLFLTCIAAGVAFSGCGGGGGSDDNDEPDPDVCEGASCEPEPTLNLAGSWLAQSSYRLQTEEAGESSADIPDAVRKEVFIVIDGTTPEIHGCRGSEVTNVTRTGDETLSFDYLGMHYALDITDANNMSGSFAGELVCEDCTPVHTDNEDGTTTLEKIRSYGGAATDPVLGTLDYQLNDEMTSVEVSCFADTRAHGTVQEVGGGTFEASLNELSVGFFNSANPAQVGGVVGEHDHRVGELGWRSFGFLSLSGFGFEVDADDDENLVFDSTATYTDSGVTITIESSGTGIDASSDEFVFDFSGTAGLDLTTVDASSDAP